MDGGAPAPRGRMFAALVVRNFRFFWAGQLVSLTGTWFLNLTISLIIVDLTGSASALALVTVCQFGPVLLLSPLAGRLADAVPPKRILLAVAALSMLVSLGLAVVLSQATIELWLVYGLILALGVLQAFDRVTGNAFIFELVGPQLLQNAVVLSTLALSASRSVGPGLAGLVFIAFGPAAGLIVNAAAFAITFVALLCVRSNELVPRRLPEGAKVSVLQTLREIRRNRPLLTLLVVNVFVAIATLNLAVVLTAIVSLEFGGDAGALGAAHTLNAVGAVVGGLAVTKLRHVSVGTLVPAFLLFGAVLVVNGIAPTLMLFLAAAPLLGIGLGIYQGVLNSAAQAATPPHALGRTMSLLTQGNVGMAPVGAVIAGLLIDVTSGQTALLVGAAVCAIAALVVWLVVVRRAPLPRAGTAPAADPS